MDSKRDTHEHRPTISRCLLSSSNGKKNTAAPHFREQVNPFIEHSLSFAISEVFGATDASEEAGALGVVSCILEHGVWPSPKQLSLIGSSAGFESAKKCFLDAMCSANNPLLVGMILALQLADAAGMGNEGQRQVASRLQNEVEDLVSEVFERLPQTVDGFQEGDRERGGMEASRVLSREGSY